MYVTQKKRVVAYCRVSTNDKDQANSLEAQEAFFNREIRRNPDWEFVRIYADRGISGLNLRRTEFDQMLRDAGFHVSKQDVTNKKKYDLTDTGEEPQFSLILVKNTARFARNLKAASILENLRDKGIYVYFFDIRRSTENVTDLQHIKEKLLHAETESVDKSVAVRFGLEQVLADTLESGRIRSNGTLYGYDYDREAKTLTPNEEEANVVRMIFELYASGMGGRRIAQDKLKGLKTKRGNAFTEVTVLRMLENPVYKGKLARNRYTEGPDVFNRHYCKEKPSSEWQYVEVEPLVSEELWDKCQTLREQRIDKNNMRGANKGHSNYARLIWCGECGSVYHSNVLRGKRHFYNCSHKHKNGATACSSPNVEYHEVEAAFVRADYEFDRLILQHKENVLEQLRARIEDLESRINQDNAREAAELRSLLQSLEEERMRWNRIWAKGHCSDEAYEQETSILEQQIAPLRDKIKELTLGDDEIRREIAKVESEITRLSMLEPYDVRDWNIRNELEKLVVKGRDNWGQVIWEYRFKTLEMIKQEMAPAL